MSHSKLQVAKHKLTEAQMHHRSLQYSTESSVCRVLAIIQHYQTHVLQNSDEVEVLRSENLRLKKENERLEYSLSDARMSISTAAQVKMKYERELEDYRKLIALLKELINSGNGGSAGEGGHLSRLGELNPFPSLLGLLRYVFRSRTNIRLLMHLYLFLLTFQ